MTNTVGRRDFIRALLAASACSLPYYSILGQELPRDNFFQAQLSHLYIRNDGRLQQILLVDMPEVRLGANLEIIVGGRSQKIDLSKVRKIYNQYYVPMAPVEQEDTEPTEQTLLLSYSRDKAVARNSSGVQSVASGADLSQSRISS